MIKIVFIGNGFHNRKKILDTIENCNVEIINGITEESIMDKLHNNIIDVFVIDRTKPLFRNIITLINADASINHIPIISLITKKELQSETINDGDLFVSEFVTDIEFKYYVKAMIKMKLTDDELKKETIILELRVKERTKELERKIENEYVLKDDIKKSEKNYKRILNNVPDLVYTLSLDGTILSINDNVINFGYTPEEIIGQNISSVLSKEDNKVSHERIQEKVKDPSKVTIYVVTVKTKDGGSKLLEVKSHLLVNGEGENEIFVIGRDVTETYESQQIIKEEQERYHNMFDNMRSCVAVYKTEDNGESFILSDWNKSAERIEQIKGEDLLGKHIYDIFPGIIDIPFYKELQTVYKKGTSIFSKPFYYKNPNTNVEGWRENFIYKLKSTDEVVAIYDNVTDRIEQHAKLEKAKEEAEQSNKIKSVFISNMSHEIRTPMNSILGFTSLLENEKDPIKIKGYIDIITNSGELLITLIDDIMDLSKMESGNMTIKKTIFNLSKMLKEIQQYFKLEIKNRKKESVKILIKNNKIKNVYTDYKRLMQVLNNLLLNAIKFTEEGFVKCECIIENDFIKFSIKDSGIGIKEENKEKVFDRFFQIDREKSKKQEGTGLGLTICKAIIELLGGEMWIESEFGIGTSVYFTIPIEEPTEQNLTIEPEIKVVDSDVCVGKKVLIVEDNQINYDLLEIILLSSKMVVDRAIDHTEFFVKIEDTDYDLILLDIQLPEYDGWQILEWLQQNKKEIPVVIQTAYASMENEIKSLEMGATAFFSKPINASSLLNKIKEICMIFHEQNS